MYLVKIINDDETVTINDTSTSNDAPRITGKIKQGINCISSFIFQIFQSNPGYGRIIAYKTKITVYNIKKGNYEFVGRAITPGKVMDTSGLCYNEYVCEDIRGYLHDSKQMYGEYHGMTPEAYLRQLIDYHNQRVDKEKQFVVRTVTVTDSNDSIYRYTSYDSTYNNISSDLIDKLGGEIWVETDPDTGVNYIDYLENYGEYVHTPISLGYNMTSCHQKPNMASFATRIIPLGCKLKDASGKETGERLTITSVNNGKNYVQDDDLIATYGVIEAQVIWDDVTTATALLTKAMGYLASLTIQISNTVTALDLSMIGLAPDSFEVGNYYPVHNPVLGIDEYARIVEKTIVIENPSENTFTLGDRESDIIRMQAEQSKKTMNAINAATNAVAVAQTADQTASEAAAQTREIATAIQQLPNEYVQVSQIGAADGVCPLNASAKVPDARLPLVIDHGTYESAVSTAGGNTQDFAVEFAKVFTETPNIVVGFRSDSSVATFGMCSVAVVNESASGFSIRFFNADNSNRNPAFEWVAIGV